jgi:1-acyl-sn-glycerol-3-phosphate acyltransferase
MEHSIANISTHSMARHMMACLKLFIFLLSTAFLLLLHLILYGLFKNRAVIFMFHRFNCLLFGLNTKWLWADEGQEIKTLTNEEIARWQHNKNITYLGNHISYLDILVLAARLDAGFVAKADVRQWPLFGYLATLQGTVFISRNPKDIEKVSQSIASKMAAGGGLIIFPEGTSSDGRQVLPLKSSLFSLFTSERLQSQGGEIMTFTIKLEKVEDIEVKNVPALRDFYAWYDDMTLLPHLWALAHLKSVDLKVTLAPVDKEVLACNRKQLSAALHKQISNYL